MNWSLNYQEIREPELLDELFLSIGRSLFIASAFEEKCRWILKILKFIQYAEETDPSAALGLVKALKNGQLASTIQEMGSKIKANPEDIGLLLKAKDARNFIAHDAALIRDFSCISEEYIHTQFSRLDNELDALIAGDNLISAWVYEISEREPAPQMIQTVYPKWVKDWVFDKTSYT